MQVRRSFHVGSKTLGCLHTVANNLREYYLIYEICLVERGSPSFIEHLFEALSLNRYIRSLK